MPIMKDLRRHSKTQGAADKGIVRLNFEEEDIDVKYLKEDVKDFSELAA